MIAILKIMISTEADDCCTLYSSVRKRGFRFQRSVPPLDGLQDRVVFIHPGPGVYINVGEWVFSSAVK